MITLSKARPFVSEKVYLFGGVFFIALAVFALAGFSACKSEPPPPPPPAVLRFDNVRRNEIIELNIEGVSSKPKMQITLSLLDVTEAPDAPDAALRTNLRFFFRQNLYNNQGPNEYARGVIENYRPQYLAQADLLQEHPDWPTASMNWEYIETIALEAGPAGSKMRIFSRNRRYYMGSAHPQETKEYFVSGESGPDKLTLDYFIQGGSDSEPLYSLVATGLRRNKGFADGDPLNKYNEGGALIGYFEERVDIPEENFFFNNDGAGFYWNAAEIAPHSDGPIKVVVPYDSLQNLLTSQGRALIGDRAAAK